MSISAMLLPLQWLGLLVLLQAADAAGEVVEVPDVHGIACPFAALVEREKPGVLAGLEDRARDHGAGADVHMVDDPEVAEDHRCPAEGAVPADIGATCDPYAAGDRRVRADAGVVADLDQVVELRALLDHRVVEMAAVDGRVRADLDVVADAHRADLRDLDPALARARVAEAVGADHGSGVNDAARADRAARVDHHARL